MIRILSIAFLAIAVAFFVAPDLLAQKYTIEQTVSGGNNRYEKGQTFTPSVGIDPDPGAVSTINLKTITFYRNSTGYAGPSKDFYLNIYDGDPVNGTGVFVGSSINTVDVDALGNMDPATWTFDHLTLDYNHEYWALFSSTNTSGDVDSYCGLREGGNSPYAGGAAICGNASDPWAYTYKTTDLTFDIVFRGEANLIEQTVNGGYNKFEKGQTFTPSIGIDPDPGAVLTMDLTEITFFLSDHGYAGPSNYFYLNIYDGDPVNGTGMFVGSSTNSVDVSSPVNFDPVTWTFDNLTLDYNHEYWALFSSTNTSGDLDSYCGLREGGNDPYTGGAAICGSASDPWAYTYKTTDLAFEMWFLNTPSLSVDIKANGDDGPVTVTTYDNVTVTIDLVAGSDAGTDADVWVLVRTGVGNKFSFNQTAGRWFRGWCYEYVSGPLADLSDTVVDRTLPAGTYTCYFGVDSTANGSFNVIDLWEYDMVEITVVP